MQQLLDDQYLFLHSPVGVSLSDARDNLVRVNAGYERFTGFDRAELVGGKGYDGQPEGMFEELHTKGWWLGEQSTRRKDGSVVVEKVTRLTVGDDSGNPDG